MDASGHDVLVFPRSYVLPIQPMVQPLFPGVCIRTKGFPHLVSGFALISNRTYRTSIRVCEVLGPRTRFCIEWAWRVAILVFREGALFLQLAYYGLCA